VTAHPEAIGATWWRRTPAKESRSPPSTPEATALLKTRLVRRARFHLMSPPVGRNVLMTATVNAHYEDLRMNDLAVEQEMLGDAVLEATSNAEESTKTGCEAHRLTAFPSGLQSALCCPDFADRLKYSNHGPNTDMHLAGYSLDRKSCFPKPYDFIPIEDPARTTNRVTGPSAMLPCCFHAGRGRGVEIPTQGCSVLQCQSIRHVVPSPAPHVFSASQSGGSGPAENRSRASQTRLRYELRRLPRSGRSRRQGAQPGRTEAAACPDR
jgi:hypothetical protein